MTMRHKLQIINFFFSDIVFCKETKLPGRKAIHTRFHLARSRNTRPLANPFHNHSCVYPGKGTTFGRGVGPRVIYHKKYPVGFLGDNAKGEDLCWGVNFCRCGFNWIITTTGL